MQLESRVYFIEAPSVGLVKIGRSIDIGRRFDEIRLISPVRLILLGSVPGDYETETAYHRAWIHLREHGEWFIAARELMECLEADSLVAAWNRACPEARQLAMEQIDAPIFDRAVGA